MRRVSPVALPLAAALLLASDPASADPNCVCRARGQEFQLGASICLPSPKGPRMATCGMVLNNTSWQFSDTPCVISTGPAHGPDRLARRGMQATAAADMRPAP
jgi:hypothetical protein